MYTQTQMHPKDVMVFQHLVTRQALFDTLPTRLVIIQYLRV